MGCGLSQKKAKQGLSLTFQLKHREISITPGTFVRHSTLNSLKDYKQLKKIGSGSFSDVFLCTHLPTNTNRVLKTIYKACLRSQQKDAVMLLKEIQILKKLDHPNILKCFEVFEDSTKYYIATEYCSGGDLFEQIASMKSFNEGKVAKILFQIFSAVSYCHDKNIIHRDIKPENIFLISSDTEIQIKLGDFGSSCIANPGSSPKGCFGSSYYIAPEVLSGSYTEKCDIWSIGIIAYILLTGIPPYSSRDNKSILKEIHKNPFQLTPENIENLSVDSIDLITKLLKISPNARISASEALQHSWISNHRQISGESLKLTLLNLKNFHNKSKLQNAVQVYTASQIATNQELKEIRKQFQALDKDGNGKLTKNELLQEYSKTMNFSQASEVVDKILLELDKDNDGFIDYTEFLVSCGEKLKKIVRDNLKVAFQAFDLDKNGVITVDEIREILQDGQMADEETWKSMLKEADMNGDGVIDFQEFARLMCE